MADLDAGLAEPLGQAAKRGSDHAGGRQQRMLVDDEDTEVLERVVPGRRQGEAVADAGALFVGAGNHLHGQDQIGGAPGHWANHGKIDLARQGRAARRRVPAPRHQMPSSACGRRRRNSAPAPAASRRCRSRASAATKPAASAAAEPPEDPPGVRPRSQGLLVVP